MPEPFIPCPLCGGQAKLIKAGDEYYCPPCDEMWSIDPAERQQQHEELLC